MGALLRLMQSLPLVIALVVIAAIVYFVVSWIKSPTKAKEVLIKVFLVISIALTVIFGLASAYTLFEQNFKMFELAGSFLAVAVVSLLITLICRWRFNRKYTNFRGQKKDDDVVPTEYLE